MSGAMASGLQRRRPSLVAGRRAMPGQGQDGAGVLRVAEPRSTRAGLITR